jgi:hypothetical protein
MGAPGGSHRVPEGILMNTHCRNVSVLCSITLIACGGKSVPVGATAAVRVDVETAAVETSGALLNSPSGALLVIPFGTLDHERQISA